MKNKKLNYSIIKVSDALLEECFARHEQLTGIQREYVSKQILLNLILSNYARGNNND
jgi:hypothetical protein